MASKNDLNVSNIDLVQELALANEDIALPVENPDLPIVESSSPNGYFASAIAVLPITNGGSLVSNGVHPTTNGNYTTTNGNAATMNGHSATTNGVQLPTNGESSSSNGHSSKTNGESNLTNGEDFVTRPEYVHDRAVQVLLQNWPVLEIVKQRFDEEKIDYCQLASLVDEDLAMLGVEDVQTQKEMVVVFSQLANQNDKKMNA